MQSPHPVELRSQGTVVIQPRLPGLTLNPAPDTPVTKSKHQERNTFVTNPNSLAQSVIDQINEIPGLDNVPAPGPNQKTNTRPAAADQPTETAYGVCHFPDNNLDAAIPVIKDWHAKVSEECRSDPAAILTDLRQTTANGQSQQRGWILVCLMPLYESQNAETRQAVINQWQAGYTPQQADNRMALALMAIFKSHLEAGADTLSQFSDSDPN